MSLDQHTWHHKEQLLWGDKASTHGIHKVNELVHFSNKGHLKRSSVLEGVFPVLYWIMHAAKTTRTLTARKGAVPQRVRGRPPSIIFNAPSRGNQAVKAHTTRTPARPITNLWKCKEVVEVKNLANVTCSVKKLILHLHQHLLKYLWCFMELMFENLIVLLQFKFNMTSPGFSVGACCSSYFTERFLTRHDQSRDQTWECHPSHNGTSS